MARSTFHPGSAPDPPGQRDREAAAFARGAFNGNGAAEQFDDAGDIGQAEPDAFIAPRQAALDLDKRLEDRGVLFADDANAGVR